jgi:hypothetical protein
VEDWVAGEFCDCGEHGFSGGGGCGDWVEN